MKNTSVQCPIHSLSFNIWMMINIFVNGDRNVCNRIETASIWTQKRTHQMDWSASQIRKTWINDSVWCSGDSSNFWLLLFLDAEQHEPKQTAWGCSHDWCFNALEIEPTQSLMYICTTTSIYTHIV